MSIAALPVLPALPTLPAASARLLVADPGRQLSAPAEATLSAPLSRAVLEELGLGWRSSVHQWAADSRRLGAILPALLWQASWRTRVCLHERAGLIVVLEPRDDNGRQTEIGAELDGTLQAALARGRGPVDTRPRLPKPPALSTVMLVEDDPLVRAVCRRVLQDRYFVLEAGGGAEALAVAGWLPWAVDLLVSDINLPHMDGIALAQHWRRRWPMCPVLFLSGSFIPESAGHLPALFLHKPFQTEELLRCTETLLRDRVAPKLPA
jgi:CheY-like chemotaxis protein